jgi:uncharacterized membrane protein YtjA (UPF0391 family)
MLVERQAVLGYRRGGIAASAPRARRVLWWEIVALFSVSLGAIGRLHWGQRTGHRATFTSPGASLSLAAGAGGLNRGTEHDHVRKAFYTHAFLT